MSLVIPGMYQDADKMRHIVQVWERPFETGAVLHCDLVDPRRDCRFGVNLFFAFTGVSLKSIGAGRRKPTDGVLDGVAKVHAIDAEFADSVLIAAENAFDFYFHALCLSSQSE